MNVLNELDITAMIFIHKIKVDCNNGVMNFTYNMGDIKDHASLHLYMITTMTVFS